MKIVNIVPGFGGTFYCGNCLRDSVYTSTLNAMGHDSIMLPLYLPLSERNNNDETPIFYGAVNIYLKQNFRIFRNMPSWLENILNSKPVLKFASGKAGSTRAEGLEKMTISMLKGKEGYQNEELHQLIDFLKIHIKPDIVHLSNALLLGIAESIHNELSIPVICSLQDEDVWVDAMETDYREKVWNIMSEKAKDIDAFVAVSNYYAGVMKNKLNIPDYKMHVVYIGVDPEKYGISPQSTVYSPQIGYLSRMCEENGLEILIDAFIELKDGTEFKNTRLKLYGGMTSDDKHFVKRLLDKLKSKGYINDVEFIEDYIPGDLSGFFINLSVLSVPVIKGEAFGLYLLESLASGVPVVQPSAGAFPEIIEATGGGHIYNPNNAKALASAFAELLANPDKLNQMSIKGRDAVENKFNSRILTEQMIKIYKEVSHENRIK